MYLGEVVGTVVAEAKVSSLRGHKLMLVQPVNEQREARGELQVAVDTVQAGEGDFVYLVGSREASLAILPDVAPIDAAIVGIVDDVYRTVES